MREGGLATFPWPASGSIAHRNSPGEELFCQIDKDVLVKKRRITPGKTAIDVMTGICKHVHRVQEI
jgi:hypothetical protein